MKSDTLCLSIFLKKELADWLLSEANEFHTSPSAIVGFLIKDFITARKIEEEENERS